MLHNLSLVNCLMPETRYNTLMLDSRTHVFGFHSILGVPSSYNSSSSSSPRIVYIIGISLTHSNNSYGGCNKKSGSITQTRRVVGEPCHNAIGSKVHGDYNIATTNHGPIERVQEYVKKHVEGSKA
ncbi:hypothetical protein RJT34_15870 [Clitoria ternatea]|uniref:Uncharacterized protein n=1 Tax=Clitoria ternatea TaxID=43366 RepID=A0AAN9J677_CLITE